MYSLDTLTVKHSGNVHLEFSLLWPNRVCSSEPEQKAIARTAVACENSFTFSYPIWNVGITFSYPSHYRYSFILPMWNIGKTSRFSLRVRNRVFTGNTSYSKVI